MNSNLPKEVEQVVNDLSSDESVNEIWLIGSQASGNATPQSDWDLLIISDREPIACSQRTDGIDVLWRGPSGRVLLEGQPDSLGFKFGDFHWSEYEIGRANYRGRKFSSVADGVARDADDPIQKFIEATAVRLWARDQGRQ